MRHRAIVAVLLALAIVATAAAPTSAASRTYVAHLTGANERPNAVDSLAQGQAIFTVSKDGTSIEYRLIVANIDDVLMAHIHLGPADGTGGVVVWLYPSAPPPQLIEGTSNGVLATGTITDSNLVGSLSEASLSDLIEAFENGETYVNVHTNTYPGGEIRGQIG